MSDTSIEWTDKVWNPVRGCAIVSEGCRSCYAMRQAHRFSGKGQPYEGLTVLGKHGPRWNGTARFVPEKLAEPLSWRKPRRCFVNSMSDLFHEDITNEQIAAVFGVMAATPHITYQLLTKRAERLPEWFEWVGCQQGSEATLPERITCYLSAARKEHLGDKAPPPGWPEPGPWPLPNVWLGVSAEDQQRADERIPLLLQCPAAVRWVSAEPLLGPIDFEHIGNALFDREAAIKRSMHGPAAMNRDQAESFIAHPQLAWVVAGGESGQRARECDADWMISIVRQCEAAGVPVFVKQDTGPKPGKQGKIPDALWALKQFPETTP